MEKNKKVNHGAPLKRLMMSFGEKCRLSTVMAGSLFLLLPNEG
ncbi:MAG: hypothetical protein OEV42_17285 [Deltaproteobacteria bacterium]|nr:hypothetical protein [Deltaproteobacteria bacterium]